jgi:dihydrofolate synthase / folylpolyglutamate synthase
VKRALTQFHSQPGNRKLPTYPEAIAFLYNLRWFGAKFGLENTRKLAALAGNPQDQLRFIHVAGTNGKGSTCAMLESIYRASGVRTGLFTSPHLVAFGERIQVNRRPIPEADLIRLVSEMQPLLKPFPQDQHPTFFEVVTVMALRYFLEQKCELIIWETGLGGRLDATNIVTPLASVITNIQYDHQKWLGETLESIAREKAGIIKQGVPVISGAEEPEASEVIETTARERKSPLTFARPIDPEPAILRELRLPLPGLHQRANAAVALGTVQILQPVLKVSATALRAGLSTVDWPGRLQLITRPDGQKILLDGAHNPAGAQMLAAALEQYFPSEKAALVLGILQDKDWAAMCRLLAPFARKVLLVPVHSERTAQPHELAQACKSANAAAEVAELGSLPEALQRTAADPFVVIAGSLYLVGEAMEKLGVSTSSSSDERKLNEWTASPQTQFGR